MTNPRLMRGFFIFIHMWTYTDAKPYADKIGGKIVGSVKTKGKSTHDLDILVHEYTQGLNDIMESMGFVFVGSMVVSPSEIKKSRKFGGRADFWLRNYIFDNPNQNRRIELWTIIKS